MLVHLLLLLGYTLATAAQAAALSGPGQQQWCIEKGVQLESQQQWEAAVQAYYECRHASAGPVAAWSMFRAFHVLHVHLKDNPHALAACKAGWDAPHLN